MNEKRYSIDELRNLLWKFYPDIGTNPSSLERHKNVNTFLNVLDVSSLSQETEETAKYRFVIDHWIACKEGGGNIFRRGDVQEYSRFKEAVVCTYKDGSVSHYPITEEELLKVAVSEPPSPHLDRKIEPLGETDIMEVGTRTFGEKINELVERFNQLQEERKV